MNVQELISHAPKQVAPYFDTRIYAKGSSILKPDESNSFLYLLLEGTAEVYQYTFNGMFISLYRYGNNSCFGEVELYCESRTTLGVTAIDTCRIVKLSKEGVEIWIREDKHFCEFLLRQMALKIAENSDAYIRNSSMELKDRVLYCLYRHERMGTLSSLTKDQLMNEVCTPIRSLNRILSQYREEGLIDYDKRRFHIVDKEKFLDAADKLI